MTLGVPSGVSSTDAEVSESKRDPSLRISGCCSAGTELPTSRSLKAARARGIDSARRNGTKRPMTSSADQPKIFSAAGFHDSTRPSMSVE